MSKKHSSKEEKLTKKTSFFSWFGTTISTAFGTGSVYGRTLFSYARHIGWFVVTTGIVTAMPLIFEVKREGMLEELENAQIGQGLAEGKSPQELAALGLSGAVEPKVF